MRVRDFELDASPVGACLDVSFNLQGLKCLFAQRELCLIHGSFSHSLPPLVGQYVVPSLVFLVSLVVLKRDPVPVLRSDFTLMVLTVFLLRASFFIFVFLVW
jgi:hypothetical protein